MSRSYKKTPIIKNTPPIYRRFMKKQANRKVRRTDNIHNFMQFKKVFPSWAIYDYVSLCPREDKPHWMTDDYWEKCYLRK